MKADAHYDKGRRIAATQAKLDPAAEDELEILRAGNVYGARTNGAASADARRHQETISNWAAGLHP